MTYADPYGIFYLPASSFLVLGRREAASKDASCGRRHRRSGRNAKL